MFRQVFLDYPFDGLEPWIDTLTMELHYLKHHLAYTNNFNDLVSKIPAYEGKSAEYILMNVDLAPPELRQGIINNGGGYYNHNLYFDSLSPSGPREAIGGLAEKIDEHFGNFANMKEKLTAASQNRFGSGYGWLVMNADNSLEVTSTPNQDSPIMSGKSFGLLPLDVWEHAYYLKYKNMRADYLSAIWNVLDWGKIGARYNANINFFAPK